MEMLWPFVWMLLVLLIYVFLLWRIKIKERLVDYYRLPSQLFLHPSPGPNDIINSISGRRIQDPIQHYPNSHLPNEHITFTNEQNKFSKSDDGLPSYEEAIKLSMAHSNSLQTYQTELAQTHQQPQSTTATRNNIRMVPGTVLSQTTE